MNYTRNMRQDLTFWAFTGVDAYGQSTFSAPVTVKCRWQDQQVLFRNAQGQERISSAIIYPAQPLGIKGYVKLGIDATANPLGLAGAYEIQQAGTSPDLRNNKVLNKVWI
jgi:hypothetical protein